MRSTQNVEDRFWEKVARSDGCWEWLGPKTRGYGTFHVLRDGVRRTVKAHRFAYELVKEQIPAGLEILHSCDNRGCVNPSHLSVGTRSDNMRDMVAKGRGNFAGRALLTHCVHGHEFTPDNIYWTKQGHRKCRECLLAGQRAAHLRKNPGITPRGPRIRNPTP